MYLLLGFLLVLLSRKVCDFYFIDANREVSTGEIRDLGFLICKYFLEMVRDFWYSIEFNVVLLLLFIYLFYMCFGGVFVLGISVEVIFVFVFFRKFLFLI